MYSWEDMCSLIDKMCYHLCSSIEVNKVLLRSFLLYFGLTYGQENNHNKYCMYYGYLCIEPCLLAYGCIRWRYPLVVLTIIYKLKLKKHCLWDCIESELVWQRLVRYLLTTFPLRYSHGAWWFGHRLSILFFTTMLNLWTMGLTLTPIGVHANF